MPKAATTTSTVFTKLNNQDNHNEYTYVACALNGNARQHLRHTMRENFNQRNERRGNSDECHNGLCKNKNNKTINNCCCADEQQHNQKQQRPLRPNLVMNYVNNMQSVAATTTTSKSMLRVKNTATHSSGNNNNNNKRILNDNNSCCRADGNIKWNYECPVSESDNGKSTHTHKRTPTVTFSRLATTKLVALPTTAAAPSSTCSSLLPAVLDRQADVTTTTTHTTTHSSAYLPPTTAADTLPALQCISGMKMASKSFISAPNRVAAPVGEHSAVPRDTGNPKSDNKVLHFSASSTALSSGRRRGCRKRKHCKRKRKQPTPTGSTLKTQATHEMSTKTKANANTKTTKSTFNAGILTSFLLNSAFLALCNATAATALSAMAAVLGGDAVGGSLAMSEPQSATTAANSFWYEMANVSLSNNNNNNGSVSSNEMLTLNGGTSDVDYNDSDNLTAVKNREYIFDRTDVRIIFVPLYILVFCCCFFGNLLVILVVTLSRRLRSITNFFLANLALADFCVGLFCVLQNLSIYLIESWVFGKFLCRMYQFVHSLSYTASIFILVVICMERYFAIVHPITCKQILTATRLRLAILTVWVTSAVYSTPKFLFSKTITNIHRDNGHVEVICVLDRKMFNSQVLDIINFGLLYVIPLLVMTVLYSKIAIALWRSSHGLSHHLVTQHQQQQQQQQQQQDESMSLHNSMYHHHNHNHHHQQHQHLHQQLSYDRHTTQMTSSTPTNNINHQHHNHPHHHHQHYHLQQATTTNAQQQQLLGSELTTSTAVLGVIGMGSVGTDTGCVGGGGGGGGGDAVTCGIGAAAAIGNNMSSGLLSRRQSSKYEKRTVSATESQVSLDSERPIVSACRNGNTHNDGTGSCGGGGGGGAVGGSGGSMNSTHKGSFMQHHHNHSSTHPHPHQRNRVAHMPHASNNVLRARRGVVRMLIIFVLTFALCNLPYHARKMWQYWSHSYRGDSNFNALLTPLTFLVTYFNSGINPLLYAFLSRNFRKGMRELVSCSCKKKKSKSSLNSSMHHKRVALQVTHSLPTDTTHIGNEQL